ncbi:MAG: hypothetical protein ACYTF7_07635 [Planctomycetota bacterium]|jgi:hypothetical protein
MHTPPRLILVTTLVCSIVVMLSAIAGAIGGLRGQDYYFAGFETVLIVCGCIGIFIGLGRFNDGPSVAIACVGGATAMCSVLGYMTIGGEIFVSGSLFGAHGQVMGVDVFLPFLGRLGIGALLGALAGVVLLARDPRRSMPLLIKGVVLGLPVIVVVGLWFGVGGVRGAFGGLHMLVQVFIGAVATVVGIGLISASGHCLIRAFEIGVEVARERERAQETAERAA